MMIQTYTIEQAQEGHIEQAQEGHVSLQWRLTWPSCACSKLTL